MTREQAKELLPLIKAFAEGKTIEERDPHGDWKEAKNPILIDSFIYSCIEYRIKPEPKYRPFKSKEECWNEMHKHPDFGWVVSKNCKTIYQIDSISNNLIIDYAIYSFDDMYQKYEFLDGTPFGIKEE